MMRIEPYGGVAVSLAAVAGCLAMAAFLPFDILRAWTREDAFFETASWIGYWLAAVICLLLACRGRKVVFHLQTALLMFLLGARELDWHKRFTVDSILKLNYYLKVHAPLPEKIAAVAVVLFLAVFTISYAARYLPLFVRRLRIRDAPAVTVGCALLMMVYTKILDRSINILQDDYGIIVADWLVKLQISMEEPLESVIPVLLVYALYQATWAAIDDG